MTITVGIDGWRPGQVGWIQIRLDDGDLDSAAFHPTFDDLLEATADADVVAVDLPIGHDDPDGGRRRADRRARETLGPRREGIPWTPPPEVLQTGSLAQARILAEDRGWPAPTDALWKLRDRIGELDRAARSRERFVEARPEVALHVLKQERGGSGPLEHPPGRGQGRYERLKLLHEAGLRPTRSMGGVGKVGADDVLKATAVAWTAHRVATGEAVTLPEDPPEDPRTGRPVAIHA